MAECPLAHLCGNTDWCLVTGQFIRFAPLHGPQGPRTDQQIGLLFLLFSAFRG
jgi:hypothetical protein